jgi:hypothetical protein
MATDRSRIGIAIYPRVTTISDVRHIPRTGGRDLVDGDRSRPEGIRRSRRSYGYALAAAVLGIIAGAADYVVETSPVLPVRVIGLSMALVAAIGAAVVRCSRW